MNISLIHRSALSDWCGDAYCYELCHCFLEMLLLLHLMSSMQSPSDTLKLCELWHLGFIEPSSSESCFLSLSFKQRFSPGLVQIWQGTYAACGESLTKVKEQKSPVSRKCYWLLYLKRCNISVVYPRTTTPLPVCVWFSFATWTCSHILKHRNVSEENLLDIAGLQKLPLCIFPQFNILIL